MRTSAIVLEVGAVIVTLLIAREMRRQQRSWRVVIVSSLVTLAVFTAMIFSWRAG
jgi:hypothetical protein